MKITGTLKKICLIVNYNMYESKRYFTQKFAEALERRGIQTRIIDVAESQLSAASIGDIVRFSPDLTCSFNTLLPTSENRHLWDLLETPHWSILLDPAIYSTNLAHSPYSIISCVDRDDCSMLQKSGFDRAFFWPHAVEKELIGTGEAKKSFEVVFLGSCYDYESLRVSWRTQCSEPVSKILDDAIDIVFSDNRTSLAAALVQAWGAAKLPLQGVDFPTLFYYLDNYTRGRDRVELIRAVKDIPVHVFGALSDDNAVGILGWSPYLSACKNVTVHPAVPFSEGLEILRRSKIALNSAPFFKNGSHERVLTALACGALPITTDTIFFREHFKEGEEIAFYHPKKWDLVNATIKEYLDNAEKRKQAVQAGAKIVAKSFTWDKRVDEFLQAASDILPRIHHQQSTRNES